MRGSVAGTLEAKAAGKLNHIRDHTAVRPEEWEGFLRAELLAPG